MSCALTNQTATPQEYLTIPEAADYIGLKRRALYNRIYSGEIVPVETPLGWRIERCSIEGMSRHRAPKMRPVVIQHYIGAAAQFARGLRSATCKEAAGRRRRRCGPTRGEVAVSAGILESIAAGLPMSPDLAAQMAARLRQNGPVRP